MKRYIFLIVLLTVLDGYTFTQSKPKKIKNTPVNSDIKEVYYKHKRERNGAYTSYYKNTKQIEGFYTNGVKTDNWRYFDRKGNIRIMGQYENGNKIGHWQYYRNNQLISNLLFDPINNIDTLRGYWPNGNLAHVKIINNTAKEIHSIKYYENGNIFEESYLINGELDSLFRRYNDLGDLILEIEYNDGNPYTLNYSLDESISNEIYKGNLNLGTGNLITYIYTHDHKDNKLIPFIERNFSNGLLSGIYKKYYKNGKLECEGQYENDYMKGEWRFYKEDGGIDTIINYSSSDSIKIDIEKGVVLEFNNELLINETMPLFSDEDMYAFRENISSNLRYPEQAAIKGIQGVVYVQFSINTVGEVEDLKIVKGVNFSLNKEAMRVVGLSPLWEPAYQYFIPVKVQFTFPVVFILY